MPALPPYIIEPIREQFSALLPERNIDRPLGCHRSRVSDKVVFEQLVQALVFGYAYRRRLRKSGLLHEISRKGEPAPFRATRRWVVERLRFTYGAR